MFRVTLIFLYCSSFVISVSAQLFPLHKIPKPELFSTQLQHTAKLIHTKGATLRVLIYGQSISEQDWWKDVKNYFVKKYPKVNFDFQNKAIGGFSSDRLKLTVKNDVVSFYPDLILFHDYGNENDYEKIIRIIRSTTTADVVIQTDHVAKQNQAWHDQHSEVWLPQLCRKYGLALVDIRKHWKEYLTAHQLKIEDLLKDGVHLNDHGNYLMAEIIKAYFDHLKYDRSAHSRNVTTLKNKTDFHIKDNSITMSFEGNRIDISTVRPISLSLVLDDKPIDEHEACYHFSRPMVNSTGKFLGSIGSLICLELNNGIQEEDWTLTLISVDSINQEVAFALAGSKTGGEGTGISSKPFTSKSISILPDSWFIRRSPTDFSQYKWIKAGDKISWQVASMCSTTGVKAAGRTTIVQGTDNGKHKLEIRGDDLSSIKEIFVYSPPLKDNN